MIMSEARNFVLKFINETAVWKEMYRITCERSKFPLAHVINIHSLTNYQLPLHRMHWHGTSCMINMYKNQIRMNIIKHKDISLNITNVN